jgi:hypothetical protein
MPETRETQIPHLWRATDLGLPAAQDQSEHPDVWLHLLAHCPNFPRLPPPLSPTQNDAIPVIATSRVSTAHHNPPSCSNCSNRQVPSSWSSFQPLLTWAHLLTGAPHPLPRHYGFRKPVIPDRRPCCTTGNFVPDITRALLRISLTRNG